MKKTESIVMNEIEIRYKSVSHFGVLYNLKRLPSPCCIENTYDDDAHDENFSQIIMVFLLPHLIYTVIDLTAFANSSGRKPNGSALGFS